MKTAQSIKEGPEKEVEGPFDLVDRMHLAFGNSRALADYIYMAALSPAEIENGNLQNMVLMLTEQMEITETAARAISKKQGGQSI